MAALLAAWVLFPPVALAVCLAFGLLVERASGGRLPGALLLPVGMAGLVCATQLTTYWDWSAEATLPLVVALGAAGAWLGRARLRTLRPDPWPTAAALGVFFVLGAPVFLSGEATFAGYTILGDTSIHMIGADALLEYGRDFAALPPSSYEYSLTAYYGQNGYPSGGPTAIGALTSLVHLDVAWTFQPFLSLLLALMALALWSLAGGLIESPRLRAAVAFLAATPALAMAYALQGSVKEVGTAFGVVLIGATSVLWLSQAREGARRIVPVVIAASGTIGIIGLAAGVWIGPLAVGLTVLAVVQRRVPVRTVAPAAGLAAVVGAVLCYQALADLATYVEVAGGVVTAQQEVGNLLGPLDWRQAFGVWLTGDYRLRPSNNWAETRVLLGVVWAAIALGVALVGRRRAWGVALFLLVELFAFVYVTRRGSPWADGKALMIVSPAMVFAAGLGAGLLHRWRPVAGWGLAALIGLGILWSNALAYHDVSNAPRDRMAELHEVGERIDGQGPTLYPEFEEFAKHFLRHGAPEGPTEGWQRRYELGIGRDGAVARQGYSTDLDRFTDRYMGEYDAAVLRRGFASSRPPSDFERTWTGRWYEIWHRRERRVIEHLSLGFFREPAAEPDCEEVRRLAGVARAAGGELSYVERPPNVLGVPASNSLPQAWFVDPADEAAVVPRGRGRVEVPVELPRAGTYDLWIEGSFGRGYDIRLNGRPLGDVAYRLNGRGSAEHVARLELPAGRHVISLRRGGGNLRPGNGGVFARLLGPVAFTPADPTGAEVQTLPPTRWRELCGRSFDWIEAVRA